MCLHEYTPPLPSVANNPRSTVTGTIAIDDRAAAVSMPILLPRANGDSDQVLNYGGWTMSEKLRRLRVCVCQRPLRRCVGDLVRSEVSMWNTPRTCPVHLNHAKCEICDSRIPTIGTGGGDWESCLDVNLFPNG